MVESSRPIPMDHISRMLAFLLGLMMVLLVMMADMSSCADFPPGIMKRPKGCESNRCGDVDIPYPFGIGPNCSHDPFFEVTCNASVPFLTHLGLRVLDLTTSYGFLTVAYPPPMLLCSNTTRPLINLTNTKSGSPYRLLGGPNELIVRGCNAGAAVFSTPGTSVVSRCSVRHLTGCDGSADSCRTGMRFLDKPLESYRFGLTHGDCAWVGLAMADANATHTTVNNVTLMWTNQGLNKTDHTGCVPVSSADYEEEFCECEDDLYEVDPCLQHTYQGNPYLPNGCQLVTDHEACQSESGSLTITMFNRWTPYYLLVIALIRRLV